MFKVLQGIEAVRSIEAPLIFPMTALYLAVMSWSVGSDEFMSYSAIVRLNALHMDTSASMPPCQLSEEVCRRIGGLLGGGSQEAQTGKLVDCGVLE